MTEAEWLACDNPRTVQAWLGTVETPRKLRLFAVGCCRELWHLLADSRSRGAVEVLERIADGAATDAERLACATAAHSAKDKAAHVAPRSLMAVAARLAYESVKYAGHVAASNLTYYAAETKDLPKGTAVVQANLLRCIFDNPFRPVAIDPEWRTATVLELARGIYTDRAWDRPPVLADALEDAGCTHPDVIGHLRGPGPHARGCWVVDLILGLG